MQNHSNENDFHLNENGRADERKFPMNGFARRLVLTQRQKITQEWPIHLIPKWRKIHYSFAYVLNQEFF